MAPSVLLPVLVILAMAAFTVAVGVYLLVTNPPKDRSKFLGLGVEKAPDSEFED